MKALFLKLSAMAMGLLGLVWQSRSAAKHKERSKQAQKSLKKVQRAKRVKDDIKRKPLSNVRSGLRKHRRKR